MKKALFFFYVLLIATYAWADRTDVWSANSVVVYKLDLSRLPDGGCSVQAYGRITKSDGGTTTEGTESREVSGANRTACLDLLDTKGPVLFKAERGL